MQTQQDQDGAEEEAVETITTTETSSSENLQGIQLGAIKPSKREQILSIIEEIEQDEQKKASSPDDDTQDQDEPEELVDEHGNYIHSPQREQQKAAGSEIVDDLKDEANQKPCCNLAIFRGTMAIFLYVVYGAVYLGDMLSMLLLWVPTQGGGIMGCDCDEINAETECVECWNCVYSLTYTKCEYFEGNKTRLLYVAFPVIFGYCSFGWLVNELTIWIRMCMLCDIYNKEGTRHQEQRTREADEFVMANAGNYFGERITKHFDSLGDVNHELTMHRNDTIKRYERNYDADKMGLCPCCFEDVDLYHMKVVLMQNTQQDDAINLSQYKMEEHVNDASTGDIGARCYECPCFAFSWSLSMCWLCPFRYFWFLAVCDLKSKYWKRMCWFSLVHLVLFDVVWIVYCKMMLGMLGRISDMEINQYLDALQPFLEDKMYCSASMVSMIGVVWVVIGVYTASTTRRHDEYRPVAH